MNYSSSEALDTWLDAMPEDVKQGYQRLNRMSEVLTTEPEPKVGQTPKEVIWKKKQGKTLSLPNFVRENE